MLSTIIISGVLVILIFFAIRHVVRSSKNGGCAGCSGCSGRHSHEGGCSCGGSNADEKAELPVSQGKATVNSKT